MEEKKMPYEIHITISISERDFGQEFIEKFKTVCKELKVKPIVLDLEISSGNIKDVMTSSKIFGSINNVHEEIDRIVSGLESKDFKVVREKIESAPWHPEAPSEVGDKMPENCYFEAHIGCIISSEEKSKLNELSKIAGAHLSKNAFKKYDGGKFVNMVTLRNYDCISNDFILEVEGFSTLLKSGGISFEKVETEFCLYDTKVSHDYLWLK